MLKNRGILIKVVKETPEGVEEVVTTDDLKSHFEKYKWAYLGGGIGLAVGVLGMAMHHRGTAIPQVINTIAPVFNNSNSSTTALGGHLHKIVRNDDTGEIWESVTSAARDAGVPLPVMSKHLNGHTDHVYGKSYSIIGVGN